MNHSTRVVNFQLYLNTKRVAIACLHNHAIGVYPIIVKSIFDFILIKNKIEDHAFLASFLHLRRVASKQFKLVFDLVKLLRPVNFSHFSLLLLGKLIYKDRMTTSQVEIVSQIGAVAHRQLIHIMQLVVNHISSICLSNTHQRPVPSFICFHHIPCLQVFYWYIDILVSHTT